MQSPRILYRAARCAVALAFSLGLGATAVAQEAEKRVTIGTGSTGGVYYPLGGGMAEIFSSTIDGLVASAQVTGATIANVRLVGTGDLTLGIGNASAVLNATKGEEPFPEQEYDLQALAALYASTFQFVVRSDSGIDDISQLAGKTVGVGPAGGATRVLAVAILEAYGIADDVELEYLEFNEATDALKDRNIDGSAILAGYPMPTIVDLDATTGIKILPVSDTAIEKMWATHDNYEALYTKGTLPGGTYSGVPGDVPTVQNWNLLFANADADQDMIYEMTKAIFENLDRLRSIHPAANQITPETAINVSIDLAPGALKYYQEIGVK